MHFYKECAYGGWQVPGSAEWTGKLETQKSQWCHSSPKAGRCKTQEEPVFQVKSKSKQKLVSQFEHSQSGFTLTQGRGILFVLFRPSTDWRLNETGWEPATLERAIWFFFFNFNFLLLFNYFALLKSMDLNVTLIQRHPHKNTQKRVWLGTWAPVWSSQVVK